MESRSDNTNLEGYDPILDDFDLEPDGTIGDLGSEMAAGEDTSREYLRARFIEQVISTLRHARYEAKLSQKDIADELGTKQPAIARLERAEDVTLGRVWDYLVACGKAPLPIQVVELGQLRDFVIAYPDRPLTLNSVLSHGLMSEWRDRSLESKRVAFSNTASTSAARHFLMESLARLTSLGKQGKPDPVVVFVPQTNQDQAEPVRQESDARLWVKHASDFQHSVDASRIASRQKEVVA